MKEKIVIITIKDFYKEINNLKKTRELIFNSLIKNKKPSKKQIHLLNSHLRQLKSIKKENNNFVLI